MKAVGRRGIEPRTNGLKGLASAVKARLFSRTAAGIGWGDGTPAGRFWQKVAIGAENECWPWTAGSRGNGYGAFRIGRKVVDAHVVAHELAHGAKPLPGMWVTHRCDNRSCCNPSHLVLGTPRDNFNDMVERSFAGLRDGIPPHVHGEMHGAAKLTWEDVQEIRSLAARGRTHSDLSASFGVHRSQIRRIVLGERWRTPPPALGGAG
jgi:hypothetical protein